ncbi:alanine--tRNA ligase [Tengunoibacter tsumagoiensis]|uniref:Alanine--tRNA ligase n=1 Tax=Tengunoibacter tsumagoiensis TaxID=2014871 RepID=A0A402A2I4_9CHLR|nr:alanine--tRNA ligase [Tengunoibacter tsumagoiensis]GCE13259.1 alanine--tRNA ligase [Tengunoibacter tsumagoiensis]
MNSMDIRRTFLDYFIQHQHVQLSSSQLVPANDPTLLFVNAGMVPFKETFLDISQRTTPRATTVQKCLRVSGKHNDFETVGSSPRHHTFFEMLGNFSFGDYFKREAIQLAWGLLVQVLQLPLERLWFTVYRDDDEAARLWEEVGAPRERILRFGEKDNFWTMGETGPCGPCSEIHYYQGSDLAQQQASGVNSDDDDYMEIWNLVFMHYNRDIQGHLTPLERPCIDTGMGFERLVAILQGVKNNYETDLFQPLIERLQQLLGQQSSHYRAHTSLYHTIVDHSRAITFLLADGIAPANEGRSYVVRRILRRAAYLGQRLGMERPFLAHMAQTVIEKMGPVYPELVLKQAYIQQLITDEEGRFRSTLVTGLQHLEAMVQQSGAQESGILPGSVAFTLHDTYGFPVDLTQKVLSERLVKVDLEGYEESRREQQERSRSGSCLKQSVESLSELVRELPPTEFVGYTRLECQGTILSLEHLGQIVHSVHAGESLHVVVDCTPFYAESGGQVADTGLIYSLTGTIKVTDVQKLANGLYLHEGKVEEGIISIGEQCTLQVDRTRRYAIMRHHTATHLLHQALREVLGAHAEQAGSLVSPEHLRFDFRHPRAVTLEQLREIERRVQGWIRSDYPVSMTLMSYTQAREQGAMALFGEKYGDMVRVVSVNSYSLDKQEQHAHLDSDVPFLHSQELCSGTHVLRTGQLGSFHLLGEGSVSSGLRRIEAVAGLAADAWVTQQYEQLQQFAIKLSAPLPQLSERIDVLVNDLKQRTHELAHAQSQLVGQLTKTLLPQVRQQGTIPVLTSIVEIGDKNLLRQLGQRVSQQLGSGIVALGALIEGQPHCVILVSADLIAQGYHAGTFAREVAKQLGGGGGGRPEIGQAGGGDYQKLENALHALFFTGSL